MIRQNASRLPTPCVRFSGEKNADGKHLAENIFLFRAIQKKIFTFSTFLTNIA
jgi:hypothetical protein